MKNLILILFVMSTYLGLAWATQDRPVFDPKTKKSIKAILEKINESEEIEQINNDEIYNSSQAGLITDEKAQVPKAEQSSKSSSEPLNSTKN